MSMLPSSASLRETLSELRSRSDSLKQQRVSALRSSDRDFANELADEIGLLKDGMEKLEQFAEEVAALENRFGAFCALYHWRV